MQLPEEGVWRNNPHIETSYAQTGQSETARVNSPCQRSSEGITAALSCLARE
jgi:hypothetical protein